MHRTRFFFLMHLILLLVGWHYACAQQYNFRLYNVEHGLIETQVQSFCQDRRGYLWIATRGGLSAYDGTSFTNFTVSEGLKANTVRALCMDSDGKVWIGTDRGLSFANGLEIINNDFTNNFHNVFISVIYKDFSDRIWLGTRDQGVYCYNGHQLVHVNRELGLSSNTCLSITSDQWGRIFIGTVNGLNWLDDQGINNLFDHPPESWEVNKISVEEGLTSNRIEAIHTEESGHIWLGTFEGGVNIFKLGEAGLRIKDVRHLHKDKKCGNDSVRCVLGLVDESVTTLTKGLNSRVWIGSNNGLSMCEKSDKNAGYKFTSITTQNGLGNDMITDGMLDREGNLWFGTNSGISMFEGMRFVHVTHEDGLSSDLATSVFISRDSTLWVGTWGGGMNKVDVNNTAQQIDVTQYNSSNGLSDIIYNIAEFTPGNMMVGTERNGMYRIRDGQIEHYDMSVGVAFQTINVVKKDKHGILWMGAWGGGICVTREDDPVRERFLNITKKEGLAGDNVASMVEDHDGNMWVGTQGGLTRISNKQDVAVISAKGELPDMLTLNESNGLKCRAVYCLRLDASGNLWMGTDNGVTRLDLSNKEEFNFTQFTKKDGLSSNTVYVIDFDSDGNLWIGSNKGLDRINMSIYNVTGKVFTKHYGKLNGFRGIECVQNASAVDHQGNLWFATNIGVTKYNLEEDRINKIEPITNLKGIKLFFESVDWTEYAEQVDYGTGLPLGLELPYDKNHLTFDFVGVSLTIPDNVKYRFYLMGLDNVWSPPSSTPEAVYSNIPPGEYTFMVMSANNDGIWNKQPVKFRFVIKSPFWKTWWFTLMCILGIVGGLYTYLSRRENRIMKQQKVLEEMVTERTHQLNEKKKEVELQNEEIAKKNKDITGSIYYAQRIQEAILPDRNDLEGLIPESFIFLKPKDIVSGDFYWFKQESDKVFIAAVDCTGHGVPGAFMSMVANQLLSRIVIDDGVYDPGEVLRLLHNGVIAALASSDQDVISLGGLDMVLCSFDLQKMHVDYSCGSRPLLRIRDGKSKLFKGEKYPVGMILEKERYFTTHSLELKSGDKYYIYSDGYTDQFGGPDHNKFMTGKFIGLLEGFDNMTMAEQKEGLEIIMDEWIGDKKQIDDMLVIGVGV